MKTLHPDLHNSEGLFLDRGGGSIFNRAGNPNDMRNGLVILYIEFLNLIVVNFRNSF